MADVPKSPKFLADTQAYSIDDSISLELVQQNEARLKHNAPINNSAEDLLPVFKTESDIFSKTSVLEQTSKEIAQLNQLT